LTEGSELNEAAMQQFPWQVLIIPALLFVAWLLSLLFKPSGDGKEDPRQAKRPGSDVDRFLAEARRRRQAQEQQATAARPGTQAPTRPSPPQPQRPPEQQAQRFRDPYVATAGAPGQRPPLQPVATGRPVMLELVPEETPQTAARPVAPPVVKPVPKSAPKPVSKPPENRPPPQPNAPAPPPPPPVASTVPPTVSGRDRPTSNVLAQVVKLLRSPQSAAAAVILREILDRPRSNRPLYPPA
jgi:hypothetical protein